MATRIDDYKPVVTDESRAELEKIASHFSGNPIKPYLVGGWAVYYYTKSRERAIGSKDIDLIFQNKDAKDKFVWEYCTPNGYRKKRAADDIFGSPYLAKQSNGVEIILDMTTLNEKPRITNGISVSWKPLAVYRANFQITGKATLPGPAKELLIYFKSNALVSRTQSLSQASGNTNYLQSKIWKDAFDILALHDAGLDQALLEKIGKETGFTSILQKAKQIISANYENYGFTQYSFAKSFLEA